MDATWLPGIIAVGALGFIWWDIRRSRIMNETKLKSALYKKDGITVYVPRGECHQNIEAICKKTDEIKAVITKADEKREQARKEDSEKWETLQHTLGIIDGYMKAHQ